MDDLQSILDGKGSDDTASAAADTAATDGKPEGEADKAKPEASAPSAEQGTTEVKPEGDKPDEAKGEPAREEKGKFTKQEAADDVVKMRKELDGVKAALQQERGKRQQLQGRKPEKDPFTDLPGALDERDQIIRTDLERRNFELLEEMFVGENPDYPEIVDALIADAKDDPAVAAAVGSLLSQKNAPKALYQFALHRKVLGAFGGDLSKYNASIEKPHKDRIAQLEADLKAANDRYENLSKVPSSLNSQGSVSGAQVANEAADRDRPLADILGPPKRKRA